MGSKSILQPFMRSNLPCSEPTKCEIDKNALSSIRRANLAQVSLLVCRLKTKYVPVNSGGWKSALCWTALSFEEFEMVICPRCGYLRQPKDDDFVSKNECPKCGIVYEKFERMQRQLNAAKKVVHLKRRKTNQIYLWSALVWLLVIVIYVATSNGLNKPVPIDSRAKWTPQTPQNWQTRYSQPKPAYNFPVVNTNPPPFKYRGRDISNAIHGILEAYNQPMDSSHYYENELDEYQWDDIKALPNYAKIQYILWNYHRQHVYVGNDFFVCVDMAMDVWDLLTAAGIPARLMVGNVQTDITQSPTITKYLATMHHVWILAEVSPSTWIPLETTGGYIVEPSIPNFRLYNMGAMFENPKEFKDFTESRKSMFATCKQIAPMQAEFNRLYAGRPVTGESTEYTGRMMQKIDDCKGLVGRVATYLSRR